jgi:hypothetical protein
MRFLEATASGVLYEAAIADNLCYVVRLHGDSKIFETYRDAIAYLDEQDSSANAGKTVMETINSTLAADDAPEPQK